MADRICRSSRVMRSNATRACASELVMSRAVKYDRNMLDINLAPTAVTTARMIMTVSISMSVQPCC